MSTTYDEEVKCARRMVKAYTEAEIAVLTGNQAYTIGGQSLTRADLDKIRKGRQEWEGKLGDLLKGPPRKVYNITFMD